MEPEFYKLCPEGISVHAERMFRIWDKEEDVDEAISEMNRDMVRAAISVATTAPDIIVYGCTGGSMLENVAFHLEQSKLIEEKTGIRAIATSTAVMAGFEELEIKKVAVATPYVERINMFEKRFLEGNGYEVLRIKGLGLMPSGIRSRFPSDTYRLAREVDVPDADGIFISCTNFRTIEIIDMLERDLGKPVVTSNQATIWYTFRSLGISQSIKGYGELFLK
jgi:maleate isomerase